MTSLEQKLSKLKKLDEEVKAPDWQDYKTTWVNSINDLYNTIMYKYFQDYEEKKLMNFSIVPVGRFDTYLGEYVTAMLEITLINNKSVVFEPIAAVTTENYGRLDFYLRGNAHKKVNIYRRLIGKNAFSSDSKYEWIIAKSYDVKDQFKLDKAQIEKLIEEWL